MSRKPLKSHSTPDHASSNDSDQLFDFSALLVGISSAGIGLDTVGGSSGFSGYGLGFDAPSDAELNDVWGESEFDFTAYIGAYQSDQFF